MFIDEVRIKIKGSDGGMTPASPDQQKIFMDYLNKFGVEYSLHRSFNQNLNAVCGQLAIL